ncbi:hypothetical protein EJ06DRAFT_526861 [Trichodelitschia bisporula]|uniref:Uncharacterized protein n=1 Tax=Trichodelitschia bisporula TaxID=703511 RepID=A0A6G1I9S6_9PEZI|nr:hypothetical protein EJ06DRAFT_526861 [Trichodelitschia bisporula]
MVVPDEKDKAKKPKHKSDDKKPPVDGLSRRGVEGEEVEGEAERLIPVSGHIAPMYVPDKNDKPWHPKHKDDGKQPPEPGTPWQAKRDALLSSAGSTSADTERQVEASTLERRQVWTSEIRYCYPEGYNPEKDVSFKFEGYCVHPETEARLPALHNISTACPQERMVPFQPQPVNPVNQCYPREKCCVRDSVLAKLKAEAGSAPAPQSVQNPVAQAADSDRGIRAVERQDQTPSSAFEKRPCRGALNGYAIPGYCVTTVTGAEYPGQPEAETCPPMDIWAPWATDAEQCGPGESCCARFPDDLKRAVRAPRSVQEKRRCTADLGDTAAGYCIDPLTEAADPAGDEVCDRKFWYPPNSDTNGCTAGQKCCVKLARRAESSISLTSFSKTTVTGTWATSGAWSNATRTYSWWGTAGYTTTSSKLSRRAESSSISPITFSKTKLTSKYATFSTLPNTTYTWTGPSVYTTTTTTTSSKITTLTTTGTSTYTSIATAITTASSKPATGTTSSKSTTGTTTSTTTGTTAAGNGLTFTIPRRAESSSISSITFSKTTLASKWANTTYSWTGPSVYTTTTTTTSSKLTTLTTTGTSTYTSLTTATTTTGSKPTTGTTTPGNGLTFTIPRRAETSSMSSKLTTLTTTGTTTYTTTLTTSIAASYSPLPCRALVWEFPPNEMRGTCAPPTQSGCPNGRFFHEMQESGHSICADAGLRCCVPFVAPTGAEPALCTIRKAWGLDPRGHCADPFTKEGCGSEVFQPHDGCPAKYMGCCPEKSGVGEGRAYTMKDGRKVPSRGVAPAVVVAAEFPLRKWEKEGKMGMEMGEMGMEEKVLAARATGTVTTTAMKTKQIVETAMPMPTGNETWLLGRESDSDDSDDSDSDDEHEGRRCLARRRHQSAKGQKKGFCVEKGKEDECWTKKKTPLLREGHEVRPVWGGDWKCLAEGMLCCVKG